MELRYSAPSQRRQAMRIKARKRFPSHAGDFLVCYMKNSLELRPICPFIEGVTQQAKSRSSGVTSVAERKRKQRARDKELLYSRDDWQLFLNPAELPQKAGCHPSELRAVVLKELVDNSLDSGGKTDISWDQTRKEWLISGTGVGPPLSAIPKLFSVHRPLISSKLKRTISRGLLGNGLRVVMAAVHALNGSIVVALRGHRLTLAVDPTDGTTKVVTDEQLS